MQPEWKCGRSTGKEVVVNPDLTGTFEGVGELRLHYQCWSPSQQSPRAAIVQVHGLGGHGGRYMRLVRALTLAGYAVYSLDLRGHGQSQGQRGYINCWAEFRDDLEQFHSLVRLREPDAVLFFIGHSLGATITLDFLLRKPDGVRGAIICTPALDRVKASPVRIYLGQLLSWVWPQFSLKTGFEPSNATRDLAAIEAYELDPLHHKQATARLVTEYFATIAWIHSHTADWQLPLLVLNSGSDLVVAPAGSRSFFQQVTFPDKTLREYPGAYHDLFNDFDAPQAIADVEAWLGERVQS